MSDDADHRSVQRRKTPDEIEQELLRVSGLIILIIVVAALAFAAWITRPSSSLWKNMADQEDAAERCRILEDLRPYENMRPLPKECQLPPNPEVTYAP